MKLNRVFFLTRNQENIELTTRILDSIKPIKTATSLQKDVNMLKNSLSFVKCDKQKTPALIKTPNTPHSTATFTFKKSVQQFSAEVYLSTEKSLWTPTSQFLHGPTRRMEFGGVHYGGCWEGVPVEGGKLHWAPSVSTQTWRTKRTSMYVILPVYWYNEIIGEDDQ